MRGAATEKARLPMVERVYWLTGMYSRAGKNLGFLEEVFRFFRFFRFFLDFAYKYDWTQKLRPRKNILYTVLSVTSFSINYNKTHKSQLNYEILKLKCDLYKIIP